MQKEKKKTVSSRGGRRYPAVKKKSTLQCRDGSVEGGGGWALTAKNWSSQETPCQRRRKKGTDTGGLGENWKVSASGGTLSGARGKAQSLA